MIGATDALSTPLFTQSRGYQIASMLSILPKFSLCVDSANY